MKLNLNKAVETNLITATLPIPIAVVNKARVIVLPGGVAHSAILVKDGSNVPVPRGTRWDGGHKSQHLEATYGIEGYGSIVIYDDSLVGNVIVTANYLGGGYVPFDDTKIPTYIDTAGFEPISLYWDEKYDASSFTVAIDSEFPGGYIETSVEDVSATLALFNNTLPSGVDDAVVSSQVAPMVTSLQDVTGTALPTISQDIVSAINEIIAAVSLTVVSTIWEHETTFLGNITSDVDLTTQVRTESGWYLVWGSDVNVTRATENDSVVVDTLSYGAIVYLIGGSTTRSKLILGTEEPLTRLNRVDSNLVTDRKDVIGAIDELITRRSNYIASGDIYPVLTEDFDFTNYRSAGEFQLIPIGRDGVVITGKFRNGNVSRVFNSDEVGVLYIDGFIDQRLVKDYPELHHPIILSEVTEGDRTVSGIVKTLSNTLKGLGPQLGHLITVVNRGVAPEDSIDLQQRVVSAGENSELHALLSAAYGTSGANSVMPPVTHTTPAGVFEEVYTFVDSVVNAIVYNPTTERYLIHRVEGGMWSFLTSYNAADDSYVNLPTVSGIDVIPNDMIVAGANLYMAQATKLNKLALSTNIINTVFTHTKVIKTIAISAIRNIAYLVDAVGDLYLVDMITGRDTKLDSDIDKGLCVLINEVLWIGKGNELIKYEVDKVVDRETRSIVNLGHPLAVNVVNNTVVSVHTDIHQLESSGVLSKLGPVSDLTTLTFDSLKWGFVGAKGGSLYALSFQQTLKNFIKE
jgi:hypothetical protein